MRGWSEGVRSVVVEEDGGGGVVELGGEGEEVLGLEVVGIWGWLRGGAGVCEGGERVVGGGGDVGGAGGPEEEVGEGGEVGEGEVEFWGWG